MAGSGETKENGAPSAEDDIMRRMLASMLGLPRICVVKKCRRRNRCFGAGQICLEHHRGLAQRRLAAIDAANAEEDAEAARR